jgi:type I restriction enzyme S subunit
MKWENHQLKEISNYWTGKVEATTLDASNYVSTDNLIPDRGGIVNSNYVPITGNANSYSENDVLISNIRPYFKKIWFADKEGGCSNDVLVFRAKENVEPLFLYYQLSKDAFFDDMVAGSNGTKMPRGNKTSIMEFKLQIPPLPTQRKIASILSAYDDLIENNLKRLKLLEEKAFLRYKGIVRSEKMEEKSILNICYVTDGTHDSPKQQVDGFYLVTGKHLIGGFIDFSSAYFISEADHDKIQKRSKVVNGDLVLSNIGTIGNVAIIDSPFEFSVKNVIIFKPSDSIFTSFLYCYLNSVEMQIRFQQESSGTSQRFISLAYTRALKVKLPNEEILKEFHQEVSILLKLKSILNQQNTKLREARDILLPKLMNGQITV